MDDWWSASGDASAARRATGDAQNALQCGETDYQVVVNTRKAFLVVRMRAFMYSKHVHEGIFPLIYSLSPAQYPLCKLIWKLMCPHGSCCTHMSLVRPFYSVALTSFLSFTLPSSPPPPSLLQPVGAMAGSAGLPPGFTGTMPPPGPAPPSGGGTMGGSGPPKKVKDPMEEKARKWRSLQAKR